MRLKKTIWEKIKDVFMLGLMVACVPLLMVCDKCGWLDGIEKEYCY
jgi:hypothetical protein